MLDTWVDPVGAKMVDPTEVALFERYVHNGELLIEAMLDNCTELPASFYPHKDYYLDLFRRLGLRGLALKDWPAIPKDRQLSIHSLACRLKMIRDFASVVEREENSLINASRDKLALIGALYKIRLRMEQVRLTLRDFPSWLSLGNGKDALVQLGALCKRHYYEYLQLIDSFFVNLGVLGPLCDQNNTHDIGLFGHLFAHRFSGRPHPDIKDAWRHFFLPEEHKLLPPYRLNVDATAQELLKDTHNLNWMVIIHFSKRLYEFRCGNYNVYLEVWSLPPRHADNLWIKIASDWKLALCQLVADIQDLLRSEVCGASAIVTWNWLVGRLCDKLKENGALKKLGRVAETIRYQMYCSVTPSNDLIKEILELNWMSRLLASLMGEVLHQISALPAQYQLDYAATLYPQLLQTLSQCNILHQSVESMIAALQIRVDVEPCEESLVVGVGPDPPTFLISSEGKEKVPWPEASISLIEIDYCGPGNTGKSSRTKIEPVAEGGNSLELDGVQPRPVGGKDRSARSSTQ